MLEAGGNAIDAGVAAGIALGVLQSDIVNVAGVAPIILYHAESRKVFTVSGLGVWPKLVTPDYFMKRHGGKIPRGLLRTVVPAAPDAWIQALQRWGTMSFGEVAAAAVRFAKEGFAAHPLLCETITTHRKGYEEWPSNRAIYLPNGRPPKVGEVFVQSDLAKSLQYMIDQEQAAAGKGRQAGLEAARSAFYTGDIGRTIVAYHEENGGLLRMARPGRVPLRHRAVRRRAVRRILGAHLRPVVPGTGARPDAATGRGHGLSQAAAQFLRLRALADRDHEARLRRSARLLRRSQVRRRAARSAAVARLCGRARGPRPRRQGVAGYAAAGAGQVREWPTLPVPSQRRRRRQLDTSYVCAVDRHGNVFSATPSDVSSSTPVIPGTGLCPSSRGSQSWADPVALPASVAPGKRPRLTPSPALALGPDGRAIPFGTPGGDVQAQAMLQTLLNRIVFGMDPQAAVEAPRFATYSFPDSFEPHGIQPGRLMLEARLPQALGRPAPERRPRCAVVARLDLEGRRHLHDRQRSEGGAASRRRRPASIDVRLGMVIGGIRPCLLSTRRLQPSG